jgi:ribosomal protein S12 methylthiotransferase accessory factor
MSSLESLVSPYGLVSRVSRRRPARGLEAITTWVAQVGTGMSEYQDRSPKRTIRLRRGAGVDPEDPARGHLIAVAEGAERYAAGDFLGEPVRFARARELEGAVIDLASIPRCSTKELAVDGCPLTPFDPEAVIRWVRGTDLVSGEPTWIPAVMTCYRLLNPMPAERFWYRISTGYAVHTDPVEALVRGVCEVIERDAIALTWLQRLPLPTVPSQSQSSLAADLLAWYRRHFVETYLFDATTDIGVPTVYCLQIAEFDIGMRQAVSCGTGRSTATAVEKALLEALRYRLPGTEAPQPPREYRDFSNISDGAAFMGRLEMATAFDFLTTDSPRLVAPLRPPHPENAIGALAAITSTLAHKGMHAVAVDRTTRELAAAGLTAVCVVVPELQPMSLYPLAQYRAHPRLYEAPLLMGYRSVDEEELNPWPQPFA